MPLALRQLGRQLVISVDWRLPSAVIQPITATSSKTVIGGASAVPFSGHVAVVRVASIIQLMSDARVATSLTQVACRVVNGRVKHSISFAFTRRALNAAPSTTVPYFATSCCYTFYRRSTNQCMKLQVASRRSSAVGNHRSSTIPNISINHQKKPALTRVQRPTPAMFL